MSRDELDDEDRAILELVRLVRRDREMHETALRLLAKCAQAVEIREHMERPAS